MNADRVVAAFRQKVKASQQAILEEVGRLAYQSIVDGSPLTGAPGQPVDEGELRASWKLEIGRGEVSVTTHLGGKAWAIEHGVRRVLRRGTPKSRRSRRWQLKKFGTRVRLHVRSGRGGFHSVAQTRAGMQRLVDEAVRTVVGGKP